jgi:hypothetical protein
MFGYDINFAAVAVSAVVAFVIGMLWYSPLLFGNVWMKLTGKKKSDLEKAKKKGMGKTFAVSIVSLLIMAGVLKYFIDLANASTVLEGAQIGFHIWLGFVATVLINSVLWEGKPVKLYLLNIAHYFVVLLVLGSILAVWA